jgi:hypothetical protein
MELEIAEAGMNFLHQGGRHRNNYSFPKAHSQTSVGKDTEDPELSSEANHNSTMLSWRESGLLGDFSFGVSTFSRKSDMK